MQTPLPARRPLARKLARAGAAPSARAQLFRGAVTASMVVFWRFILHTPNRSPRPCPSPCKPARRALPLSREYRASRARPASRSGPCVRKLSPVPPRQASGWHPLRCGGESGPNRAPSVICFGCSPPHLRSGFSSLCSGESGSFRTSEPSEIHPASLRSVTV